MSLNFFQSRLDALEALVTRSWSDRELLLEAVAIPGCGIFQAGTRQIREGNKRLAMIGDSVLDLVIKTEDYTAGKLRGDMSDHICQVGANDNIQRCGFALGLDNHIFNNPSSGGRVAPRVMADTVEAIIGAAFLDGSLDAARQVMRALTLI